MNDKILIIGGGVAGLAAAVRAIEQGLQPVIIEKNRYLGGRVRSFVTGDLQRTIDNGQHVLSSAYEKTRWLLKKIGSLDKVYFQKNFQTHFVRTPSEQLHFRAAFLPPPFLGHCWPGGGKNAPLEVRILDVVVRDQVIGAVEDRIDVFNAVVPIV